MPEFSFPWSCAVAGDGGPQSYSVEVVEAMNRVMGNVSPTTSGVVYWTDPAVFPGYTVAVNGLLRAEHMGGGIVRIHPGVGIVQGWIYFNAPDLGFPQFSTNGGAANAIDVIGLRRDLVNQTVRLFYGRGPAGGVVPYSLVQTPAIWEIQLAQVILDGAGNFSSLADGRIFAVSPLSARIPLYSGTPMFDINVLGQAFSKFEIQTNFFVTSVGTLIQLRLNNDAGNNYYDAANTAFPAARPIPALTNNSWVNLQYEIYPDGRHVSGYKTIITEGTSRTAAGVPVYFPRTALFLWDSAAEITRIAQTINGGGTVTGGRSTVWGII